MSARLEHHALTFTPHRPHTRTHTCAHAVALQSARALPPSLAGRRHGDTSCIVLYWSACLSLPAAACLPDEPRGGSTRRCNMATRDQIPSIQQSCVGGGRGGPWWWCSGGTRHPSSFRRRHHFLAAVAIRPTALSACWCGRWVRCIGTRQLEREQQEASSGARAEACACSHYGIFVVLGLCPGPLPWPTALTLGGRFGPKQSEKDQSVGRRKAGGGAADPTLSLVRAHSWVAACILPSCFLTTSVVGDVHTQDSLLATASPPFLPLLRSELWYTQTSISASLPSTRPQHSPPPASHFGVTASHTHTLCNQQPTQLLPPPSTLPLVHSNAPSYLLWHNPHARPRRSPLR